MCAISAIELPFEPPYNWSALLRFLAPRAIPGVERVAPDAYARTFRTAASAGRFEVSLRDRLYVQIEPQITPCITERLQRVFDTRAPIATIESHLHKDPQLAPFIDAQPGLRIPGAWDNFELAIRAILGQQVTVKGASTLAGRIAEMYGEATPYGRLFPTPETLAGADLDGVGLPRARANSIRAVAAAFASASPPQTAAELRALPGIGDWTAQYISMRAFKDPDAFPATDLGLLRAAGPDVARRSETWRPWRAYAAMHLWMSL